MDRRITYGLLIALVVLIVLAGVLDSNIIQPVDTPSAGSVTATLEPLWTVDIASINVIRIEDLRNKTIVEVQKDSTGTWMVMDIPAVKANKDIIEPALSNLAKMVIVRDFGDSLDPKEFNLESPDYQLTVKTADGKEFVLEIGALNPTGTGYYVRMQESKRIVSVSKIALSTIIGFLTNKPIPATITPTFTITPTSTPTPTVTPTFTLTPTIGSPTVTPTNTPSAAVSETGTPGTPVPTATTTLTPTS